MIKKISVCFVFIFCMLFHSGKAQDIDNQRSEIRRNYLNVYLGFIEYNLNYERNIVQFQKSYSNLRLGFGFWGLFTESGYYINPSIVHLIGKMNSHLEFNLGMKLFVKEGFKHEESPNILADFFVGYRFEKPNGKFVFRTGFNFPTLFNLGIGFKF
jgi:hypothetical protein